MKIEIKNKKVFYISVVSVLLLIAVFYIVWRKLKSEKGNAESIGKAYDNMAKTAKSVQEDKQSKVEKTYASYDKAYRDAREKALQSKQTTFMYQNRKYDTKTGRTIK